MRTVYLKGRSRGGPFHSLYKEIVDFPPEGYCFLPQAPNSSKIRAQTRDYTRSQMIIRNIDKKIRKTSVALEVWKEAKTVSYILVKEFRDGKFKNFPESHADLIFCSQQLLFAKFPWIADVEYANALVGGNEIKIAGRIVRKRLESEYCKKIIPWSEWSKRTIFNSLDCKRFKEKIETVRFGVRQKSLVKQKKDDKVRFLFVGSVNRDNALNFELKGGIEAIQAFLKLRKKYDRMELVVRSWVPSEIKTEYTNYPDLKIIDFPLSKEELAKLYNSSDVFLFPSHLNLGMGILEAMSYKLPVIARGVFDVPEAVEDMKTGMLLDPIRKLPYYMWNGAPNSFQKGFLAGLHKYRPQLVDQIVEKASLLIESPKLINRLGQQAKVSIDEGKFSIKNRNANLKRIFDEALG